MTPEKFGTHRSYEFYSQISKFISKHGLDGASAGFAQLMPWGTLDEVIEKLSKIRELIDANGFMLNFSYAGMPYDEAERHLKRFAKHVQPEVKKCQTEPLNEARELNGTAHAAA